MNKFYIGWLLAAGLMVVSPAWSDTVDRELIEEWMVSLAADVTAVLAGVQLNGVTYFPGSNLEHGVELWRSDGTAEGTSIVKDIHPGPGSSMPLAITEINGRLYFQADNGTHGSELWVSDGSAQGTFLVKDIATGRKSSFPVYFVELGGLAYFRAIQTETGSELWTSDGTAGGTRLVRDIAQGPADSLPAYLTVVGNRLLFRATTPRYGGELWMYDPATDALTVQDLVAGAGSSNPHFLYAWSSAALRFRVRDSQGALRLATLNTNTGQVFFVPGNEPGQARLSWQPPRQNVDGSPFLDLVGFTVYFGLDPARLANSIVIERPGATDLRLQFLPPGTHYFAVTALSASGQESALSTVLSKLIF